MTKIQINSLVKLSNLTYDAVQSLMPQYHLIEIAQNDEYIFATIAENIEQDEIDIVVNGLRQYIIQNLITGVKIDI